MLLYIIILSEVKSYVVCVVSVDSAWEVPVGRRGPLPHLSGWEGETSVSYHLKIFLSRHYKVKINTYFKYTAINHRKVKNEYVEYRLYIKTKQKLYMEYR